MNLKNKHLKCVYLVPFTIPLGRFFSYIQRKYKHHMFDVKMTS